MVDAALTLADVEQEFNGNLPLSFNGFDLICDNGELVQAHPGVPSLLGCDMGLPKNVYPDKVSIKSLRNDPSLARRTQLRGAKHSSCATPLHRYNLHRQPSWTILRGAAQH
eukprot:TRINITY_DN6119_c0_g1_i2.p2 TRINITY_DN6119_c0_g1~~TRINITY_DN6119_c0_g1_i2.p2  ORF type:complete len:111 (+),score=5.64 TRINITY_DN6119_c0_g1_i2:207-539(+)